MRSKKCIAKKLSCIPAESDYPVVKYVLKNKNKNYTLYKGMCRVSKIGL
jgi:hypothetical protein